MLDTVAGAGGRRVEQWVLGEEVDGVGGRRALPQPEINDWRDAQARGVIDLTQTVGHPHTAGPSQAVGYFQAAGASQTVGQAPQETDRDTEEIARIAPAMSPFPVSPPPSVASPFPGSPFPASASASALSPSAARASRSASRPSSSSSPRVGRGSSSAAQRPSEPGRIARLRALFGWRTALAILGVLVAAALTLALALAPTRTPPAYVSPMGSEPTATPSAAPTSVPSPASSGAAGAAAAAAGIGSAVAGSAAAQGIFIGDGTSSFACPAALALKLGCVDASAAGGGYLPAKGRSTANTFAGQLAAHTGLRGVRMIVVSGGAQDAGSSATTVAAAASAFITRAQALYPGTAVVVVAPIAPGTSPAGSPSTSSVTRFDGALRAAAGQTGATYVDVTRTLSRVDRDALFAADGRTLSPSGRAAVAAKLAAALAHLPSPSGAAAASGVPAAQ